MHYENNFAQPIKMLVLNVFFKLQSEGCTAKPKMSWCPNNVFDAIDNLFSLSGDPGPFGLSFANAGTLQHSFDKGLDLVSSIDQSRVIGVMHGEEANERFRQDCPERQQEFSKSI